MCQYWPLQKGLAIEFHAHMLKWAWRCDGEICDFLKCHIKTKMYERNNLIFLAECKIPDEIENLPCSIHFICFFMNLVWAKGRKPFHPFAQTRFLLKVAQCRNISGCMSFCVVLGSWWIVGRPGHLGTPFALRSHEKSCCTDENVSSFWLELKVFANPLQTLMNTWALL